MYRQNKVMSVIGWILTLLVIALLGFSASGKLYDPEGKNAKGFADHLGYPADTLLPIGIAETASAVLFLIPQTAALGAVLLTGYFGGATASHVRIGEPFYIPILAGIVTWLALFCRDPRVRDILPFRLTLPTAATTVPPARSGGCLKLIVGIFLIFAVALGGFAVAVHFQPEDFRVERSATMAAPPMAVFDQINDLHKWESWSPWAKLDPNTKYTYDGPEAGVGSKVSWAGNSEVGEGHMTIVESKPGELVKIKLVFIKPMPGESDTLFTFTPDGDKTKVTWTMSGKNGFVGKAMCMVLNMDKMIGQQFDKGLASIKTLVEAKKQGD